MLVLSRKEGESIRIADNIEVVVVEIRHGKVRLGFRCPDDVPVLRQEIHNRKQIEIVAPAREAPEIVSV